MRLSTFQLTALHHFPARDAEARAVHGIGRLEGLLTPTYDQGQVDHEDYQTGWSKDSVAVSEAMQAASQTGIDIGQPRLSAGWFMSDHNEGGRCAVLVDATNSWMLFYSTFDD